MRLSICFGLVSGESFFSIYFFCGVCYNGSGILLGLWGGRMKLGIGIDTGGTYTDAVVYDFENKTILSSAKALTTKNDLTVGILNAIDGLSIDLLQLCL